MAALERLVFPLIKLAVAALSVLLILLLGFGGYTYYDKQEKQKASMMKNQKAKREQTERSSYESSIEAMVKSPNFSSLRQLHRLIDADDLFLQGIGWTMQEAICQQNKCNLRFIRDQKSLFKFVSLKKGETEYQPTYTVDDMIYEGVEYNIPMQANETFMPQLSKLESCNVFIAKTYKFQTLLKNTTSNDSIEIELPSQVFSYGSQYTWVEHGNIQKGRLKTSTNNFLFMDLFGDNYKNNLLIFDTYQIKEGSFLAEFTYYCI